MPRIFAVLLLSVFALSTGACATIVDGTSQEITVSTVPTGAACDLKREGATLAAIPVIPGTITVSKSQNSITVTCTKEEHLDASEILSATFGGTTIGNILLGGVIGVLIDASSGANNKYPSSVSLALPPERYDSVEERDSFFDAMSADTTRQGDQAIASANASALCRKDPDGSQCLDLITEVEDGVTRRLAEIET